MDAERQGFVQHLHVCDIAYFSSFFLPSTHSLPPLSLSVSLSFYHSLSLSFYFAAAIPLSLCLFSFVEFARLSFGDLSVKEHQTSRAYASNSASSDSLFPFSHNQSSNDRSLSHFVIQRKKSFVDGTLFRENAERDKDLFLQTSRKRALRKWD